MRRYVGDQLPPTLERSRAEIVAFRRPSITKHLFLGARGFMPAGHVGPPHARQQFFRLQRERFEAARAPSH